MSEPAGEPATGPVDEEVARAIAVQINDQRKPVRIEVAGGGASVEIEAPEALDVVAERAMAMWRELSAATPAPERRYGFGASGGGQHEQAGREWDAGYDMG